MSVFTCLLIGALSGTAVGLLIGFGVYYLLTTIVDYFIYK